MKKLYLPLTVILAMTFFAASAMAWGSATHAYIAERLNNKGPLLKLNQVYGAMAMDIYTLMPGEDAYIRSNLIHCESSYALWGAASSPTTKALAYGFISHNQIWGEDSFAHNYGCDFSPATDGYIKEKADELFPYLPQDLQDYLHALDIQYNGLGTELVRSVVEYAVDILLISKDPAIGAKVSVAALLRSPEFPHLLDKALGTSYGEEQFRQAMISYGKMLSFGQLAAIKQISAQAAALASGLYGVSIDAGTVRSAIIGAMWLCAPSYMREINKTILGVSGGMFSNGFRY